MFGVSVTRSDRIKAATPRCPIPPLRATLIFATRPLMPKSLADAMERQPFSRNTRVLAKKIHPAMKQAKKAYSRNSARNSGSLASQFKAAKRRNLA